MGAKIAQANSAFSDMSDGNILVFAQNVHDSMLSAILLYPTPSPSLATLQTAIDDYNAALVAAADGGKALTAAKNSERASLQSVLKALAIYVNTEQYGNRVNLLLSGFIVSKEPGPIGPLPAPDVISAYSPGIGQLYVHVTAFKYRPVYKYEYRLTGTTDWSEYEARSSRVLITGLSPVNVYDLRVAGINTSQVRNYSPIIQVVII